MAPISRIFAIFHESNDTFQVIDKLKLDAATRLQMMQEVRLMKLVQHPYVVRLYEVIDTQTKLYLVLEFADGKNNIEVTR